MQSEAALPPVQDIDVAALGRSLWRAKGWVIGLSIAAGLATFIGLSMVRPLYTSEARILIENDVSPYTRAASEQGPDQQQALDEQAVQSQVQVLTSRDLALQVARKLDLAHNPEFAKDAGVNIFKRMLNAIGLGRDSDKSAEEKAADAFAEHLAVYALNKSSVIAIDYTSGDPRLAAEAANALADAYIDWQRTAKIEQTKDATTWLSDQIDELRKKVSEGEAAVAQYRSSNGLYEGSNNISLDAQQLSELNSQLIMASAQKSEAEARAKLIKGMLDSNGDIAATPEVLKSELIARLIEQRVQVQRQLAELSATLLPSHPRIQQLNSELNDVRNQIRDEATKIVKGLENEAQVASARETSLRNSLNQAKSQSTDANEASVKLRAMEREVKANRDLLESYLARYRDASARHEIGAVPTNATIVSRAHASTTPSFPRRLPMTALVTAATALLLVAYLLARELIGGAAIPVPASSARAPSYRRRAPSAAPLAAEARATDAELEPELPLPSGGDTRRYANPRDARQGLHPTWSIPSLETNAAARSTAEKAKPAGQGGQGSAAGTSPESLLEKLRRSIAAAEPPTGLKPDKEARGGDDLGDLRHYLQQKAPLPTNASATQPAAKPTAGVIGPVFTSYYGLLNHVLAQTDTMNAKMVLTTSVSPKSDATAEAIKIARAIASRKGRVVLVDLTRGVSTISGPLRLPRSPGFADLIAGRAGFEDVVRVDSETPLQVITAGDPSLKLNGDSDERCKRILMALAQTYDCVVLHGDGESVTRLQSSLQGSLSLAIVVIGAGENGEREAKGLLRLGCPILSYEQSGKEPDSARSRLLGRVAAF